MEIQFHCSEKDNFKNGSLVHVFIYKDYHIEPHNHDFYEINIILSGTGVHYIAGSRLTVKTGDVFVIPPNVTHAYKNTINMDVYHVLLRKDFLEKNLTEARAVDGFIQLIEIEPSLRENAQSCFLTLNHLQLMQLKQELLQIDDVGPYGNTAYRALKYHAVWKILYWLSSLLYERNCKLAQRSNYQAQIITSLEYIHKNYHQKISIDDLCKISCLSRSTYLRSFEAVCGKSPGVYVNEYRCHIASDMLKTGQFTKTEIAHACGFYDLSHMNRMMDNRTGS